MLQSNLGKGGSLILGNHTWTNHRELGDDSDHVTVWTRQVSRVHRKTYEQ
jgi:hypothetical protein